MRYIRTGAALAAVALLLTGCSTGGSAESAEVDASLDPADVSGEISYAIWDVNQQPAMEELIADFNKTYPDVDVKVELTAYAQYFTKLQTQGSSGTLPDVMWMNGPNFQLFASNGLLAPLAPLEEAGLVDSANYPDAMNDIYTLDDEQYGIPKDFDTIAVFYNTEIFERAGVPAPTADWTWEDYRSIAKQITDKLGGEGIFGSGDNYDNQAMIYPAILSNGGEIITEDATSGYDSEESIEALQFWTDIIEDGSMPTPAQNADTTGIQRFLNGQAGMLWSGNWQVSALLDSPVADKVSVVELPLAPTGERTTVIHGVGNVMSAESADDPAAQAFFAYLGSEEAAVIQAELGVANPAFTGTQQAFVDSAPAYNLQIFLDAATDYSVAYPVSQNTSAWNKVEGDLLPEAFSGAQPVADVAKEIADGMNAALAKEKK